MNYGRGSRPPQNLPSYIRKYIEEIGPLDKLEQRNYSKSWYYAISDHISSARLFNYANITMP